MMVAQTLEDQVRMHPVAEHPCRTASPGATDTKRLHGVHAVVVAFHPDGDRLWALLQAIAPQLDAVWIMDNGGTEGAIGARQLPVGVRIVDNHGNMGLAKSYNDGIGLARAHGGDHVLLLDQDSLPEPTMLPALHAALTAMRARGRRVAVVGPRIRDVKGTRWEGFVQRRGFRLVGVLDDASGHVPAHHLISSGSLVPLDAYDAIGAFEERLFIDYVDIEWCMRARCAGYDVLGVSGARMLHDLGGDPVIGKRGRIVFASHAPLRRYYQYRNGTWLLRQRWVGWPWRLTDGYRLLLQCYLLIRYAPARAQNIRMISRGLRDGLFGRMGKA